MPQFDSNAVWVRAASGSGQEVAFHLQGIVLPVTIAVGLIALLAPLYMAFFVNYLALGLYGAPIATGTIARAILNLPNPSHLITLQLVEQAWQML